MNLLNILLVVMFNFYIPRTLPTLLYSKCPMDISFSSFSFYVLVDFLFASTANSVSDSCHIKQLPLIVSSNFWGFQGLPHKATNDISGDGLLVSPKHNLSPPRDARLLPFMAT